MDRTVSYGWLWLPGILPWLPQTSRFIGAVGLKRHLKTFGWWQLCLGLGCLVGCSLPWARRVVQGTVQIVI